MPKWSLTLKGNKESKYDESESVFEEITEDNFEQNERLKLRDQIGHCSEEMGLRKAKKKEKKKNLNVTTDVIYVEPSGELSLRESEEILIQEESKITQKEEGNLKELKPSSSEDTKGKSKKTHKGSVHAKTDRSKSNALETLKKKENALEILMNNSRNTKFNQNESSLEITEVIKPIEEKEQKSKDTFTDHKCSMDVIHYKEEGGQQPTKSSPSDTNTANAFDILMMKKSSNENDSLKAENPKTSKRKPYSFKLNIRYSKSASESGSSDIELDKTSEHSERLQKTKSKKKKMKKKKADKKPEENQDSTQVDKKLSKSSDGSTEKISAKEGGQGQTNDEPKDKMTKVKKKKRKTPKSADLPARDVPILVQDDSSSSVLELIEKPTKKHDSKSNKTSNVLTSPGIEDFEVTPMRKGLRKRTSSINYALMNEPIQTHNKKSKREEKQKKSSDKKKRKNKEPEKLEDIKGYSKEKRLKKEKGTKSTAETKQTLIDVEKGTLVNLEKDVSAAKAKGAQRTKNRGPLGTKDKGHSVSRGKGTSGTMKEEISGTKEKGASATKEKGAITIKEKEAPRTKEQGTSGAKKKVTLVIGSDTSPEITEVKSCQSEKEKAEKTSLTPQKLAPIFLKQKPKEKPKSDIKPTQKDVEVAAIKTSTEPTKTQPTKQLNEEELKAANTAFLALFASSKTIKAAEKPAVQANQQPTPWPTVSHVTQWSEEDQSKAVKVNQKFAVTEEVTVTDKPKVPSRKLKLGKLTRALSDEIVLKKNLRRVNDLERDFLSPAVVKKCISETSGFFPGVPMRRLYKQYKTKQDEYQTETFSEIRESVIAKKEIKEEKERESSVKEVEDVHEEKPAKSGRSKRKISTQSDEELNEKQIKKARRKKDKEKKASEGKKEDIAKAQVADQPRKKRGREEDEEEAERSRHAKRKSSRRSNGTPKKDLEPQNDSKPESSKRKKRKTMESELEVNSVPSKEDVKSEDSRASVDDKKADLLWTEKYQPECSSEVMGNASSVSRLKSWLEAWKIKREKTLRKELELQKKLLAKQKNKDKQGKKSNPEWREEEYDSDFHLSDEDSEGSDSEDSGLSSAILVVGPRGSGKTATVYACAKELGYKVFEVNCSSKRSSKQILSKLEEATQSHLVVTNPTANIPKASAFGGLFANVGNNSKASSPLSSFLAKPNKENDSKTDVKKKSQKEKDRKHNGKEKKEKRTDHLVAYDGAVNPRLASKAVSLILFEEVDLVFEDDKGFWSAVASFINNAKCPIIMTSNDSHVGCDGRYEQLILKTPSINLLSAHLQLVALVNNAFVHPNELKILVSLYKCDIRKCLLALQFWVMSGGGKKTKWKKFLKETAYESGIKIGSFVNVESSQSSNDLPTPRDTTSAVLNDGGEASLLLTAEDWKRMTTRNTRASKGLGIVEGEDDNSDFETQKVCTPAVDENTHTDSILSEFIESRSIQIVGDDDKNLVMPGVDCMLVEHTLGLQNTTLAYKHGYVDLLEYKDDVSKMSPLRAKQRLAEYSQSLGVNLINNNLPSLLPTLYTKASTNQSSSSVAKRITQPIKTKGEESLDSSVFDDGSESNQGYSNQATETMETKKSRGTEECDSNIDKIDKKDNGTSKRLQKKTLNIFTAIAEDLSFLDAFTANTGLNEYQPAEYGWWHARASSGLSDDVSTVNRTSRDWWTRDSSVSIRGGLEAASLNYTYDRYRSLVDEGLPSNLQDCLPVQDRSSIVNLTGLTDAQLGKVSSTNKLYRTANSSLPLATFCSRRSTCTEYLPTLRSICHSERLREIGNTKRRFLHYLDSLSSMSNSTMQSLADAYLVP